jgi:excisionase family DNA binding protein
VWQALRRRTLRPEAREPIGASVLTLVTVSEAADRLAVHPDTIRRLIARKELAAVHVGRNVRIEETELIAYVRRSGGRAQADGPITPGQLRALHAKADAIDIRLKQPKRTTKKKLLVSAAQQFGRSFESANEFTETEASWALDLLEEALDDIE